MDTLKAADSPAATAGGPLTVAKIGSWAVAGPTARANAASRSRPIQRGRGVTSSPLAGQVDAHRDRSRCAERDRDELGIQGPRLVNFRHRSGERSWGDVREDLRVHRIRFRRDRNLRESYTA